MRRTYLWFWQLVSGAVIVVLLGIHMVLLHLNDILTFFGFDLAEPTSWESVSARANQGIWAGIYSALLFFGLSHASNGLRNVLLELIPSARTARVVTGIIIAVGTVFFIGGTYVVVALLAS